MVRFFALASTIGCLATQFLYSADSHTGQTFNTPAGSIYYEPLGAAEGTPLVIANGGPGFDHTFLHLSDVWETFAKRRKVILYDQRGVGKSSPLTPGESCTLRDQIEDLEALRAQIGAEKIDLLGHSWGGYLVMAYAARYPEHIRKLLIVDSAAPKVSDTVFLFNDVFPEGVERQDALEFASQMGDQTATDKSLREYLAMLFYSPEKRDAALAKLTGARQNVPVKESIVQDLGHYDLTPELPKYHFPTLVITGRYDMNVAPLVAYKIHKAIPGSQFVVFDQSGHVPFYEEPDKFLHTVESFLAETP
jgi:proline iminopeptidase